jgi:N-acetylmuramoyl-L-alanine amidase
MTAALRGAPAGPEAEYRELLARETTVREELAEAAATTGNTPARHARELMAEYEDLARRHPSSGYSDNALWQAAALAADVFRQYRDTADRQSARRLLQALKNRFPSSSLVDKVPAALAALDDRTASPAPSPRAAPRDAPADSEARPESATLTDIRRELLPDAVRVTLTLDAERPFSSSRMENPSRIVVDLSRTRTLYALKDARLLFTDEVVKQVRVGRQADSSTRVVLDLASSARASVYPLYNPYRLVVDIERPGGALPAGRGREVRSTPGAVVTGSAAPATAAATTGSTRLADTSREGRAGGPSTARPPAAADDAGPRPSAPAPPSTNARGGFSLSRQLGLGISRIVIDPGHGGHDPGARSNGITEAELALDIALRLEKRLLQQPDVEVVLTRRTSVYIPLEKRTEIANRAGADLFLSIHANAAENVSTRGIETYFLNFAPDESAEALAARENAGSARTMRSLPEIVRSIAANDKADESRDFARFVQDRLFQGMKKANKQAKDLGVKQAPFQVLIGAAMPSVLVEIAFITNKQEGTLLKTDKYREQIADGLLNGVLAYQRSLKKEGAVVVR